MDSAVHDDFTTIPVVDLARWRAGGADAAALADEVRTICHHVGFFTLVGHGISQSEIDHYFDTLARFFALTTEQKATIDKVGSRHFRGWERIGSELTNNRVDHREQIDLATEHAVGESDVLPPYWRLHGPNQWPDESLVPGFRATVSGFLARLESLAHELMGVLSVGLGLPVEHLDGVFGDRTLSLAKLISYPPTPPGEAGVNEHNDAGFLTVLLQHDVGGLQARNAKGEWIDVPPTPGAFVINLGEMLQQMTGNYFVATKHRVIAHQARLSSGFFYGPSLDTELHPLPLDPSFAAAVQASERHRAAGFMNTKGDLDAGIDSINGSGVDVFGQQLWNYYVRSYPDNVRHHYPELMH